MRMELVGLMATLTSRSCPVLMPPRMPPAWLLAKRGRPASPGNMASPCSLPFWVTQAKPSPISTPLTAFRPIMAWAMSASSRSYKGSPSPAGMFRAVTRRRAPQESPLLRSARM